MICIKCPKCGSNNSQYVSVEHSGSGGSFTDACCGLLLFGPIGILCGLCGASSSYTESYWICHDCGKKFQTDDSKHAEKERIRNAQEELQKKQRRKALLSTANPEILKNIDEEITKSYERCKELKKKLKYAKKEYLKVNPLCKVQHFFRWIGRLIFIGIFSCIGLVFFETMIVPILMILIIGAICILPPYYIKKSQELTEIYESVENAKKYKEYLESLKRARDEEKNNV